MNTATKVIMWLIVAAVILAVLRNAAAAVGIILAGGSEGTDVLSVLSGQQGPHVAKGKFTTSSGTKIALG